MYLEGPALCTIFAYYYMVVIFSLLVMTSHAVSVVHVLLHNFLSVIHFNFTTVCSTNPFYVVYASLNKDDYILYLEVLK